MSKLLVLDFVGTLTDEESDTDPFLQSYCEILAGFTHWSIERIRERVAFYGAHIVSADPGWWHDGRIVAPAVVHPRIRMHLVADMICSEAQALDKNQRQLLFAAYDRTNPAGAVFRPEAAGLIGALRSDHSVEAVVVTDLDEKPVQSKICKLQRLQGTPPWLAARVYGQARRHLIGLSFSDVCESLVIAGLDRPVLLHRRFYHRILVHLRTTLGIPWSRVYVVGDIFELDLALPLVLGAHVALLANKWTPQYERDFLTAHQRGHVIENLGEVMPWLQG